MTDSSASSRRPRLVLLAAGESRRLGTPKALVRLRDRDPATPLQLLLAAAAPHTAAPLVVAGVDAAAIRDALHGEPGGARVLEHDAWHRGRTSSVRRAVEAAPGEDLCIAPVDVPLVPEEVFRALCEAWSSAGAPASGWLAPFVRADWTDPAAGRDAAEDRREFGHPILLGRELAGRLTQDADARPLRELRRAASPLLSVEVTAREILDDLDDAADLEALRRRLQG